MTKKCERCGGVDKWTDDAGKEHVSDFTDFCAVCSKDLCAKCMAKGCCGNVPAKSGSNEEYGDEDAE